MQREKKHTASENTGGGMCNCKKARPFHRVADGSLDSVVDCERKRINGRKTNQRERKDSESEDTVGGAIVIKERGNTQGVGMQEGDVG